MSSLAILQSLKESILAANVKTVYGEPIVAQNKTIIPVAKVVYGYGGGGGTGGVGESRARGEGGGGGGGARAIPLGVIDPSWSYRGQSTDNSLYSDHRPKKAGQRNRPRHRARYLVGLAQTAVSAEK